jgi:hypothetical protein
MRVLIMGRINQAWVEGTHEEKREEFWPVFVDLHRRWKELGAQLLGTIDDSIMMVGPPTTRNFNFYELYDVPDLDTVAKMLDVVRRSDREEVNIYKFLRFEAIVGPPVSADAEAFWND